MLHRDRDLCARSGLWATSPAEGAEGCPSHLAPLGPLQALQGELEGLVDVGAAAEAVLQELQQPRHGPPVHAQLQLLHLERGMFDSEVAGRGGEFVLASGSVLEQRQAGKR